MGAVISSSEDENEDNFDLSSLESDSDSSSSESESDFLFGSDTSDDENDVNEIEIELEGVLFGMGNPLLDISATVGKGYLEKYNLKANDAILAEDKHLPMYEEIVKMFAVDYIAGGATQNSIKVAQWMLGKPLSTTFVGCIGQDNFGDILKEKAEEVGVRTAYYRQSEIPTGLCAALLCGTDRSLCANLAAANNYKVSHLQEKDNWALVEQASYYYIAGFFLTVSPESIMLVAKHAAQNGKTFMMNLSAPFLSQFFTKPMMEAMPYVDILFGNETEAQAFADKHEFNTKDIGEIAKRIAGLPKVNSTKPRMVVITQGCQSTLIATGPHELTEHQIIPLDTSKIVDTNGAGDAFVGGFLALLVKGKPVKECVQAGHFAANLIIQRSGCTFPKECTYE
uniref:adenosine kinase isoform X1 n=1 Tax=Ciona intestinalis TaxID=7719 RepID=UPI000180BE66|nr:adenosine kinase isoform X1 [Ciona intestinalis]|eukprot:XP_026690632.1 adenosine kinase isoform X1 [Ciona intestinalis]